MDKRQVGRAVGTGSLVFGVLGVVAPKVLLSTYRSAPNPEALTMTRLWGTRNVALGGLMLSLDGDALDLLLRTAVVLNGADALLELLSNLINGTTGPSGALAAATSGGFAGLSLYGLSLG